MKCPKCNKEGVKFNIQINKNNKNKIREDFTAKCNKCKWEGIIYDDVLDKYVPLPKKKKEW